ncbi:MAG: Hsp70 family protein [Candidatus Aegiribacteria sp.]|nr:Hsp70 family protein [Candidatus Aegiribacteria sp.]
MSVDFIFKKCPNCSANLKFIPGSKTGQCDFCGSSFLVSTLKGKGEKSETKAMEFNRDWAQKISRLAIERFQNKYKIDLTEDSNAMERIVKASRKVAMELEEEDSTTMNVPFITANSNGPLHICEEYTCSDIK